MMRHIRVPARAMMVQDVPALGSALRHRRPNADDHLTANVVLGRPQDARAGNVDVNRAIRTW